MQFSYSQYLRGCLVIPILVSVFALCALTPSAFRCISSVFRHKFSSREASSLASTALILFLICGTHIGQLLHGGIHLIYERESDAVEFQGEIAEIRELREYAFPRLKTEYGEGSRNGVEFVIDGIECSAPTSGTLRVGDYVTVRYLPECGYILSITPMGQGDDSVVSLTPGNIPPQTDP